MVLYLQKKKILDGELGKNVKKKLKRKFSSESDKTQKKFKMKDGKRGSVQFSLRKCHSRNRSQY